MRCARAPAARRRQRPSRSRERRLRPAQRAAATAATSACWRWPARRQRVLDVGCSRGYLARRLAERGATRRRHRASTSKPRRRPATVCEQVLVGDVETMELPFAAAVVRRRALRRPRRAPARPRARSSPGCGRSSTRAAGSCSRRRTSRTGRCGSALLAGRWRYTDRGILDRTHTHLFTRKTLDADARTAPAIAIVELDVTAPVPVIGSPPVERPHTRSRALRPSLFAYQFVVAATPR